MEYTRPPYANLTALLTTTNTTDNLDEDVGYGIPTILRHILPLYGILFAEMWFIFFINTALFIFLASNHKLKRNNATRFFLNVQVSHLMISISGIGFGIRIFVFGFENVPKPLNIVNNGILIHMFLSLILKTGDKYVAIQYPYMYERLTTKKTVLLCLASWAPSIVFITVALNIGFTRFYQALGSTITITVAIICLVGSNLKLYFIARKAGMSLEKNKDVKVLKSTYVCFVLVGSFVILWFPYYIYHILVLSGMYNHKEEIRMKVNMAIAILPFFNSFLDPLLFVAFRRDVRKEIKKVLAQSALFSSKRKVKQKISSSDASKTELTNLVQHIETLPSGYFDNLEEHKLQMIWHLPDSLV